MKTMKIGSITTTYDDTIKLGDLITTYWSGYYEVIRIEDRGTIAAPLVYFHQRFDAKGNKRFSKHVKACDISFCRHAADRVAKDIQKKTAELNILKAFYEQITN